MTIELKLKDAFDFLKPVGNGNVDNLKGDKYGCISYSDCLKQQYTTFIRKPKRYTDEGTLLQIGDILIPTANLPKGELQNIAYMFCSDVDCVAGEGLHILRPKIEIDPMYVCYQLNGTAPKKRILSLQVGMAIKNLYAKDLGEFIIRMPVKFDTESMQKVNNIMIALEEKLELEKDILAKYKSQKDYLLQNMFVK